VRIHFCVTVWGKEYVEQFDSYCLGSLLAEDNLPRLVREHRCSLFVYTRNQDVGLLASGANMSRVDKLLRVTYNTDEEHNLRAGSDHWTPWRRAYVSAFAADAALVVIIPDVVYLADALTRIVRSLVGGAPVVQFPIPQVTRDLFQPYLDQRCRSASGEIVIDDRELLEMFQRFVHPKHACGIVNSPRLWTHPEYVFSVAGIGYVIRELTSHPLALIPQSVSVNSTFVSASTRTDSIELEALGLSMESLTKYAGLYAGWIADGYRRARFVNLASWANFFSAPGNLRYLAAGSVIDGATLGHKPRPLDFGSRRSSYHTTLVELSQTVWLVSQKTNSFVSPDVQRLSLIFLLSPSARRSVRAGRGLSVFVPTALSKPLSAIIINRAAAEEFVARHCVNDDLSIEAGTPFVLLPQKGLRTATYSEILDAGRSDPSAIAGEIMTRLTLMGGKVRLYIFHPRPDLLDNQLDFTIVPGADAVVAVRVAPQRLRWRLVVGTYDRFARAPLVGRLALRARNIYRTRRGKVPLLFREALPPIGSLWSERKQPLLRRLAIGCYDTMAKVPLASGIARRARNTYRRRRGKPAIVAQRNLEISEPITAVASSSDSAASSPHLLDRQKPTATDLNTALPDFDLLTRAAFANFLNDARSVVACFNTATKLSDTPISRLLDRLQDDADQQLDWKALSEDPNVILRMQAAQRHCGERRFCAGAAIAEVLLNDPAWRSNAKLSPMHCDAYVRSLEFKARASVREGRLVEAVEFYEMALNLDPNRTLLSCRTAELYWQLGNVEKALSYALRGLSTESNSWPAIYGKLVLPYAEQVLAKVAMLDLLTESPMVQRPLESAPAFASFA